MQHFKLKHIACGALALALGQSLIACSDDEQGSGIDPNPMGNAGKGGSGVGGFGGTTTSGGSSSGGSSSGGTSSGGTASGGTTSVEACMGLPLPGAPGTGGTGTGGGGDEAGAGGDDSGTGGSGTAGSGGSGGNACVGLSLEAEAIDVDLYFMMDRSVSMAELVPGTNLTRWEALRDAVQAFVDEPSVAEVGIGIGFFGRSGHADPNVDCDIASYSTPDVALGLVSDVGADVVDAMTMQIPSGLTPTLPAVQGAVQYSAEASLGRPGRAPLVILVSDGYPTQCQEPVSVADIADAALAAYEGTPSVRTYVVGLAAGFNLQSIAQAGGTERPFLVDEGDITNTFVQTMLNITNNKLSCTYEIPPAPNPDEDINYEEVSIIYTPPTGAQEEVPKIDGLTNCSSNPNGGWYYDDPSSPNRILVCPCTCSRFQAGQVDIRLGCQPQIGIR